MSGALLQWRRPVAGELDHERLWLAVGAGSAALMVASFRLGVRLPPCLFHALTGYPCPGCGSTRAMRQLCQGHVSDALWFNPMVTLTALAALAWALYATTVLIGRLPRLRFVQVSPRGAMALRIGVIATVLANWWWVIAHHL